MTGFTRPPPPLQSQGTGPGDRPRVRRGGLGWEAGQSGRLHSPNYSQQNTDDRAQPRGVPPRDIAEGHTTEKRGQERAQERRSLKKSSMSRAHSSARTPAYTSGAGATRPSRSTS